MRGAVSGGRTRLLRSEHRLLRLPGVHLLHGPVCSLTLGVNSRLSGSTAPSTDERLGMEIERLVTVLRDVVSAGVTRRTSVRLMVGTALAGMRLDQADAERKNRRKDRCPKQRRCSGACCTKGTKCLGRNGCCTKNRVCGKLCCENGTTCQHNLTGSGQKDACCPNRNVCHKRGCCRTGDTCCQTTFEPDGYCCSSGVCCEEFGCCVVDQFGAILGPALGGLRTGIW